MMVKSLPVIPSRTSLMQLVSCARRHTKVRCLHRDWCVVLWSREVGLMKGQED